MFQKSWVPLWSWFYGLMLTLNLSATPSSLFLARHLDVDESTAWQMLRKFREHLSVICARGSKSLLGGTVCVELLRFRNVQSALGNRTRPVNVLTVFNDKNAFAYVIPKRHPAYCRRILDELAVDRQVYIYDIEARDLLRGLKNYTIEPVTPAVRASSPALWASVAYGRRLATYLHYNLRKWPMKVRRSYFQDYLSDFVFRYNFAHDKALMFPLFFSSLEKAAYCDPAQAQHARLNFHRHLPRVLS